MYVKTQPYICPTVGLRFLQVTGIEKPNYEFPHNRLNKTDIFCHKVLIQYACKCIYILPVSSHKQHIQQAAFISVLENIISNYIF